MSASPEYSRGPTRLLSRPIAAAAVQVEDEGEGFIYSEVDRLPECTTPTREEVKLPVVPPACPPAPRKPLRVVRCKRRLSEREFVVVRQEEMESLFRRRDYDGEKLNAKKKRKMIDGE